MIDPIAIGQTKEYICKEDKVNPTVWIIGSLDSFEKAQILNKLDKASDPSKVQEASFMLFETVRYGLKGFRNFKDVEFETETVRSMDKDRQVVSENLLRKIPFIVISELATEIWGENMVSEEQAKN